MDKKSQISDEILRVLQLSESLIRYKNYLMESGLDEDLSIFATGNLVAQIQDQIAKEVLDLLSGEDVENYSEEKLKSRINEILLNAKGLDAKGYADFLAEEKVREFERLGDEN